MMVDGAQQRKGGGWAGGCGVVTGDVTQPATATHHAARSHAARHVERPCRSHSMPITPPRTTRVCTPAENPGRESCCLTSIVSANAHRPHRLAPYRPSRRSCFTAARRTHNTHRCTHTVERRHAIGHRDCLCETVVCADTHMCQSKP
mmetsp:Transcript_86320/g.172318  ORF Transcript_86320/g.172318 Transcript_86320/m.172318 type:complete len:147 (-) Transcript_86320:1540-1980(-)